MENINKIKIELDKKKEEFKLSMEKKLKDLNIYFQEVIDLKNKYSDFIITFNEKINRKKQKSLGTKTLITNVTSDFVYVIKKRECTHLMIPVKYIKLFNSIKIVRKDIWNLLLYLRDEFKLKEKLIEHINKELSLDLKTVTESLGPPKKVINSCIKCGKKLHENAKFCPNCGLIIVVVTPKPEGNIYSKDYEGESVLASIYKSFNELNDNPKINKHMKMYLCGTTTGDLVEIEGYQKYFKEIEQYPNYFKYCKEFKEKIRYTSDEWKDKTLEEKNCMMCKKYKNKECIISKGYAIPCAKFEKSIIQRDLDNLDKVPIRTGEYIRSLIPQLPEGSYKEYCKRFPNKIKYSIKKWEKHEGTYKNCMQCSHLNSMWGCKHKCKYYPLEHGYVFELDCNHFSKIYEYPNYRKYIIEHPNAYKYTLEEWKERGYENKNCMLCKKYKTEKCGFPDTHNFGYIISLHCFEKKEDEIDEYPNYKKYIEMYLGSTKCTLDVWKKEKLEEKNCMMCENFGVNSCLYNASKYDFYYKVCSNFSKK